MPDMHIKYIYQLQFTYFKVKGIKSIYNLHQNQYFACFKKQNKMGCLF